MPKIEHNIPIPKKVGSHKTKSPERILLELLGVGDSFTVAQRLSPSSHQPKIASMMFQVSEKTGKKFVRRTVGSENGVPIHRIWRVE